MTVDVCELALWLHYWKTRKQDAAVQIQNIARGRRGRTIAVSRHLSVMTHHRHNETECESSKLHVLP